MAMNVGRGTILGIAEQADHGTGETTLTKSYRIVSTTLGGEKTVWSGIDALAQGDAGVRNASFIESVDATFEVVLEATYSDMGLLLKHIFWGTPATTGAGPYTHTYPLGAAPPTGALTMAIKRGDTTYQDRAIGCRIVSAELSCEVGQLAQLKLNVMAKQVIREAAGSFPAVATPVYVKHHNFGDLTWNSVTYKLKSVTLSINNALARNDVLGSYRTDDPFVSDHRDISITARRVEASNALLAANAAGTQADAVFDFTEGAASWTFTAHNAKVSEATGPISAVGQIEETFTMVPYDDGTDLGLELVVINAQSTATA